MFCIEKETAVLWYSCYNTWPSSSPERTHQQTQTEIIYKVTDQDSFKVIRDKKEEETRDTENLNVLQSGSRNIKRTSVEEPVKSKCIL